MKKKTVFTTLELLIVLTIIGFFVAMVAPKLVGMFSDSQERIGRANLTDLSRVVSEWQLSHPGLLPNDMTNILYFEGPLGGEGVITNYEFPSLAEQNLAEDGAEWLSWGLMNRLKPYRHSLSQEEVDELRSMGLTHIRMLDSAVANKRIEIQAGMAVMMIGARSNNGGVTWHSEADSDYDIDWLNRVDGQTQPDPAGRDTVANGGVPNDYETGIGYPQYLYRIVLGVGPDCQLIKDGTINAAPRSPDAMSREKHYRLSQYLMVLPRLNATVDAVNTAGGTILPKVIRAQRTIDGVADEQEYVVCDTIDEAVQSPEQFEIISPEGFTIGDSDEELWTVLGTTEYGTYP